VSGLYIKGAARVRAGSKACALLEEPATAFLLVRYPNCCPLKDCWGHYGWTGLDHPKLLSAPGIDEDVKGGSGREGKRPRTACINGIDSGCSARVVNVAIYADGGEGTDECSVSIEIDAFYNCFRLCDTIDNVPPMRGE
jgi:hypothetical protein